MKVLWLGILIAALGWAQTKPNSPSTIREMSDIGFVYPLSSDWILATTLIRKQTNSDPTSIVLAAVYVPGSKSLTESSPFFSVVKFRQAKPDCQQFLNSMVSQVEKQQKSRITRKPEPLKVGSNEFLRMDFEQKGILKHRALVCTTTKENVVAWNAWAHDDKGVDAVVSTLSSLDRTAGAGESPKSNSTPPEASAGSPDSKRVQVASGVTSGLLIKKVAPFYPQEARTNFIQGTVVLQADINREGDIVNLELMDGPIELVGSAVHAVRQWKYKPYLLNGEAVAVRTTIQVNYTLAPY